jgi:hypothetical protein
MWSLLSPRVPAAAAPQSYTRAARLDRVAPSPAQRSDDLSAILETTTAERLATGV